MPIQSFWVPGGHTRSYLHTLTTVIHPLDCNPEGEKQRFYKSLVRNKCSVWTEVIMARSHLDRTQAFPFQWYVTSGGGSSTYREQLERNPFVWATFWFHNLCLLQLFSVDITVWNWSSGKFLHQESLFWIETSLTEFIKKEKEKKKEAWKSNEDTPKITLE